MLGSRRTKDFQAISGCMLLQNCGGIRDDSDAHGFYLVFPKITGYDCRMRC